MDAEAIKLFWGIWMSAGIVLGFFTTWISFKDPEKKQQTLDKVTDALGPMVAATFAPSQILLMIYISGALFYAAFWPVGMTMWLRNRLGGSS